MSEMEALRAAATTVAEHCYLPCDQTVQCGVCGVVWWNVAEEMHENWHADGCALFAAEVLLGRSVDVRRDPAPEGCNPWQHPTNEATAKAIRDEINALRRDLVTVAQARFDAAHAAEQWEETAGIERRERAALANAMWETVVDIERRAASVQSLADGVSPGDASEERTRLREKAGAYRHAARLLGDDLVRVTKPGHL